MTDVPTVPMVGPIRLRWFLWTLAVLWTAAIAGMLAWELLDEQEHAREIALRETQGALEAVDPARQWNAAKAAMIHRAISYGTLWLIGLVGIALSGRHLQRQIDGRQQAEERIRAADQQVLQLEHQEKERVEAELERLRDRLVRQTQLATIGQVSAGIAHELRNPLGVIRNAAFFLKRKVPDEQPKWHQYLDIIDHETATADQIITELMDMSRGQAPTKTLVDLDRIVQAARARVSAPDEIAWQFHYQLDPMIINADPGRLEQVFRNLFTNSIHALGASGTITVEAVRPGKFDAGQCDTGQFDEITVSDTGSGIPEDMRPRVFEPLFSTKHEGHGLGLTICRQIVERHGGTIELLRSETGTALRIRLPHPDKTV